MMVAGGGLDWLTKYNLSTKEMYDDGLGGFHDESLSGLTAIKCRPYVFVCYALGGWELELGFNFE
jgi:hypothetical protein